LVTVRGLTLKFQYNKEGFSERQPSFARNWPATSECWNRLKIQQMRPRTPPPPHQFAWMSKERTYKKSIS